MNRVVKIRHNSLWHFLYNAACIFAACLGIGVLRQYGANNALLFWSGAALVLVAWMAYRWMNYRQDEPHFEEDE